MYINCMSLLKFPVIFFISLGFINIYDDLMNFIFLKQSRRKMQLISYRQNHV